MRIDEVSAALLEERLSARAEGRPLVTLDDLFHQPDGEEEQLWLDFPHPEIDEEDPLPESPEEQDWLERCNYAGAFPNLGTVSALLRSAPPSLRRSPAFTFLLRRQLWLRQILAELREPEYNAPQHRAAALDQLDRDDEAERSINRSTDFEM